MTKPSMVVYFEDKEEQEEYKEFWEAMHKGMMPYYAMYKFYVKPAKDKWKKQKEKEGAKKCES